MRIKFILYPIFSQLARLRFPRLTAKLLAFSLQDLRKQPQIGKAEKPRHRALILNLNKPGFLEDIEESLLCDSDFDVLCWPNYALKAIASSMLNPHLNNKRYASDDPAIEASKQVYRQFLVEMWQHFQTLKPIDVVLSANFGYFAQREFGAALEKCGTPFMVLHKENVKSPGRVKYWHAYYETRGEFEGRKILVYNETERDLQIAAGTSGPEKQVVTGMPRLDRLHRWRRANAGIDANTAHTQVLLFSFWRKEKVTATERITADRIRVDDPDGEWAAFGWSELCEKTHRAVVQAARMRPNARFVIKTKAHSRRVDDIWEILRQADGPLPDNLEVISGGDPFPLLIGSTVVIGFNTTALLEALAAGKPVIVPNFDEALDPRMQDLIIDVGDAVDRPESAEDLVKMICDYVDTPREIPMNISSDASHALRYWVGNEDGAAGQRVLAAVRNEVGASLKCFDSGLS